MKRKQWLFAIAGIIGAVIIFNSCKKTDTTALVESAQDKVSPELWNLVKRRSEQEGKGFTVQVNQKVRTYYTDRNGNEITSAQRVNFTSACTGFTDAYSTVLSYTQNFDCNQGFKIKWKYQVSTDNKIVLTNPSFPSQITKGLIRIYAWGTGTLSYSQTTTITPTIVDLGPDLVYGTGYESYSVEFVSNYIPQQYIDNISAYTLKLGANLAIDCTNGTSPVSIAITDYAIPNTGSGSACDRNDLVYINPGAGPSGAISINGVDPLGVCPVGYNYPTWQEVQYSVNGGAWTPVSNVTSPYTAAPSPIKASTYLSRFDFAYIPKPATPYHNPYSYQFRYRNVIGSNNQHYNTITCTNTAFWTVVTVPVSY